MSPDPITVEILKARAQVAGIALDPEQLPELARLMEISLAPLRRLDPHDLQSVEPGIFFATPHPQEPA